MKKITRLLLLAAIMLAWGNVANAQNTECAGTSTVSTQADPFTLGYKYTFATSGTDVTVTFELLDTKVGLVAYAWTANPNFAEVAMTQVAGTQKFTKTFTGQTIGATFKTSCKFAYQGGAGMAVTSQFSYTVGKDCTVGLPILAATAAATNITGTTATSGGNITAIGNSEIITRGVCWSTATGPTVALATKTTDATPGTGSFSSNITGLTSGVKYYVKSYATNTQGTAYGTEVNFVTADTELPTAFTATKGAVTPSSVELLLNATDNSGAISYSVSYGSTPTVVTTTGVSGTQKSFIISGLTSATDYTFAVSAKDASGNAALNSPLSVSATTASYPVAPVPPTRDASTVISVYSDAYTNVANTFQWWAASSGTDLVQGGNNFKLITSNNCFGTGVAVTQDISSMKYLHVDIYPTTVTTMQIGIVAPAGNEYHPANTLVANQWNSFDISLADFKTGKPSLDLTKLAQVGFWAMNGSFYLDNIYFYTDVVPSLVVSTAALTIAQPATSTNTFGITTGSTWTVASDQTWLTPSSLSGTGNATITLTATTVNDTYFARTANVTITGSGTIKTIVVTQAPLLPVALPAPTVPTAKVKSIYSDTYTAAVTVTAFDVWWEMTFSTVTFSTGNEGKKAVSTSNGGCASPTFPALDVTDMNFVHVDVFPLSTLDIQLQLQTITATTANWVSLGTATVNQWNSFNIPLSSFTNASKTDLKQVGFRTNASMGTFYMDNLYFYNDGTTGISNLVSENGISCYPNPVTDRLTINAKSEISQVVVRNLLGQTVKTVSVNGLHRSIDVSAITAGNYFVSVRLTNGQTVTQKFIKL